MSHCPQKKLIVFKAIKKLKNQLMKNKINNIQLKEIFYFLKKIIC